MNESLWCQALNGTDQTARVTSRLLQHSPELIIVSVRSDHPRGWRRKNKISNRKLCSSPVFPAPNQWRWLRKDEQTHMAVLGKETSADMPVVTRRAASHWDTAASILELVFLSLPVLMNRDLNFFLPVSIIETLLFVVTMPFTVCYKCLWWETELFLWRWLWQQSCYSCLVKCPYPGVERHSG